MTNTNKDGGGVTRAFTLATPRVPNFIHLAGRTDTMDVADLTTAEIDNLGALWTEKLKQHAEDRRKARSQEKNS